MKQVFSIPFPTLTGRLERRTVWAIGLFVNLTVIAIYNLLFFNRFFPVTEGWFSVYANCLLGGKIPYRDFYLAVPPVYVLQMAAFIKLFGNSFILLHVLGIFVILTITLTLFALFARIFPIYIACLVSVLSTVYYESTLAHVTYDFLHFVSIYALMSAYLICNHCKRFFAFLPDNHFKIYWPVCVAGVLGGLAFLTKQSNGLLVVVASSSAVGLCTGAKGFRLALKSLTLYGLGLSIPLCGISIWLISQKAFCPFIYQVFLGAAQSKGSLGTIFFAWIPRLFTLEKVAVVVFVCILILLLRYDSFLCEKYGKFETGQFSLSLKKNVVFILFVFALSIASILLPFASVELSSAIAKTREIGKYHRGLIVLSTVGTLIWFILSVYKVVVEKKSEYIDLLAIACFSIGLIYGTGMSAAVSESGVFLPLGLLFGYLIFIHSKYHAGRVLCIALLLILMAYMASLKYIEPYRWWGLVESDVRKAVYQINVKYLEGLYLSKNSAYLFSETTRIIDKYSSQNDFVFTFPSIPVFYMLSNREPRTSLIVQWFDITSDEAAFEQADLLLRFPPKIIVLLQLPTSVWEGHENLFRDGKPSGQRAILDAIITLTSESNQYVLEAEFPIPNDHRLQVWRRVDKRPLQLERYRVSLGRSV